MVILFSALIFGILVMALLIFSMTRNGKNEGGRLLKVLKIIVGIETIIFIVLFVIVIIKTLAL